MQDSECDVIVIGGGAAGLAASAQLQQQRLRVILLEGRERLGGRIHTLREAEWGGPIELGAEFIHGGNQVMAELIRASKLGKAPVAEQHWWADQGKRIPIPDAWDRIDGVMKKIGPHFRKSFAAWMQRFGDRVDPVDRRLATTFVQGFQGAPLDQMSAHTLYEATKEDEEQFRLRQGYGSLIDKLSKRIKSGGVRVELNTIVDRVEWQRGRVRVSAGKKTWKARSVLVTVPLGVLRASKHQTGAIAFAPLLKGKRRHIDKTPSGHAIRVILRLRKDIWRRGVVPKELRRDSGAAFGFLHSDHKHFPVWWALAPRPVVVGWTGGPAAASLAGKTDGQIFRIARQSLAKLLGSAEAALANSIVNWRTYDWSADPLTRGAYSFSVAGAEDAPAQLGKPLQGTIFFAGEATAEPLELGTVHGALSSGQRAAREIVSALSKRRSR